MATCVDHLSGIEAGLRIPAEEKKRFPVSSSRQGTKEDDCIFHSLIASGVPPRRNPWASFGAVAFQALLLLAAIVIPLFHTEMLPKRETLTMLYAPPASASGSNATRLRAPMPMPTSTYTPTKTGISAPVNKTREAPSPTPASAAGGVVGGVPGGVIGGVPGGMLSEVLGSRSSVPALVKTPDPAPIKRIRLAQRVVEANLIHDITPIYPEEAGRARIEGTVVLLAVIGKDGSVQDVRVESGFPTLAQAAIDAVKQWRYRPYLLNGEPVEVDSRITINFTLSRG
jgi:protein TonB